MDYSYALTPFLTWLIAGIIKFVINSVKAKQLAFSMIGYGGFPSSHATVVCSMAALIAFKEGIGHPAFGVAITLTFIVILDANSLRRQVGKQAAAINYLASSSKSHEVLRERIGHTRIEIAAGIMLGMSVAAVIWVLLG